MVRATILLVFAAIILGAFAQHAPKGHVQPASRQVDSICKQLGGGC